MQEVDWSDMNSGRNSSGNGGITFLRFERDKTYRLRPIGAASEFFKIFVEKGSPSIVVDIKDKDEAARLISEHTGKEIRPSYKAAMFVIDREDNQVKILEGGTQIYDAFRNWTGGSGIKPGAANAGDWQISVTGDGVGGNNPRKYSPVYLGPMPLTDDEKKMLSELKAQEKLKLSKYITETPADQVLSKIGASKSETSEAAVSSGDGMDW